MFTFKEKLFFRRNVFLPDEISVEKECGLYPIVDLARGHSF
jgi:hypothetical protein